MSTGRKLPSAAPEGHCQLCWNRKVVAIIDGPTCTHGRHMKDGKFDWDAYDKEIQEKMAADNH